MGEREDVLESALPRLKGRLYSITSEETPFDDMTRDPYNCHAWALGDNKHWYDPARARRWIRWPEGIPRNDTVPAFEALYARVGYEPCDDGELEDGWEKIAIYIDDVRGLVTHSARQNAMGLWLSKLGYLEDIEHLTVDDVGGPDGYGHVARYMKRRRKE